jgi:hypothetical protein
MFFGREKAERSFSPEDSLKSRQALCRAAFLELGKILKFTNIGNIVFL